ncbi:hypothetical protein LCGC14_0434760 [marine sediment metagenome]|uniref:Nuclease-associated modular DNA-binding 1 domain-containing protein n=1 Tax=marine sediment metagenome TaxID=412755 RepID=A0A0F9ST86_9ZZZZ
MTFESSYFNAKQRCKSNFKNYGSRGIKLLMTKDDFEYLWYRDKAHLMDRPTIDRIDNDGDYALQNCRFIELRENCCRNHDLRKKVTQHTIEGKFIKEWIGIVDLSKTLNISRTAIQNCLKGLSKSAGGYRWGYTNV